ncbi:MAG: preQ(1) synthase [Roseibacillus sp.]|nr:preQ(1) synthase [Roseibacillus sp.]
MSSERSDDFSLLGHESKLPASPEEAKLETFTNKSPGRPYTIDLDCPEFSSLCPVTGQPDSAHIHISYIPAELCVETKSLKYYLASFRNLPSFNEEIVNRILDDLVEVIQPTRMEVVGQFSPRGGISLTASASYPDGE